MARLTKPEATEATADRQPTMGDLRNWIADAKPNCTGEFVTWLLTQCCSPPCKNGSENPQRQPVVGGGSRWSWPYAERVLASLNAYHAMSEQDRRMLEAGVDDGVHWRGESMTQYVAIVDETMRMRQMGLDRYRSQVAEQIRGVRRDNQDARVSAGTELA